ncbi:pyocin knob domain-containing protein [Paenibacillus sanguinis]|uniref:pyocin knob domain-containing protein n=1 Tax=Paenibacillus sanguinis TaxID=225906 RepID=UPI00037CA4FE|nr:pyocin knob domain-containing protein [Paenibacillus sanguinis]
MAKTDWKMSDTVKPDDMNSIGQEINDLRSEVDNIEIPPASLTTPGIVQLSSSANSSSETLAATPLAVKTAHDAAAAAQNTANAANLAAAAAGTGLSTHANNATMHITAAERVKWNAAENNAKNASLPRATRSANNLNSITENGFYDGSSMANAPSTDWHYVENIVHSANPGAWRLQRATNFNTGVTYWRQMRSGTWTNWQTWGGGVKKVTRYSAHLYYHTQDDNGIVAVTIPAVDVNKTSINLTGYYTDGFDDVNAGSDYQTPAVYLYNATTVRVRNTDNMRTGLEIYVYFEVIEYN